MAVALFSRSCIDKDSDVGN